MHICMFNNTYFSSKLTHDIGFANHCATKNSVILYAVTRLFDFKAGWLEWVLRCVDWTCTLFRRNRRHAHSQSEWLLGALQETRNSATKVLKKDQSLVKMAVGRRSLKILAGHDAGQLPQLPAIFRCHLPAPLQRARQHNSLESIKSLV
jgi:hypothetical protein